MAEKYLIGVDLGTSRTKAALYRTDGSLVAEASHDVPIYYPRPGVVEQDNDDFYQTAAQTVRESIQQSGIDPRKIAAIAFDSQMAGIGSIDEKFKPATRFDSWLDMRCQPYIEMMDRQAGNRVTELTGCAPTCDHGPKILWWMHEQPEDFAGIAKFVTPAGYVAGAMTGLKTEDAFMDYTFIHFTGFSDSQSLSWSEELCQEFSLDKGKLPKIVEPWKIVGEVTGKAAIDFALVQGTPVAAGCGDTAACALGAGVVRRGMLFDSAGTAAVLAACTDHFIADLKNRALLYMHSVIPGLYNPLAYVAGGGLALRWIRDQFYNNIRGKSGKMENDLYDEMLATTEKIPPGADGLFFSPHLGGRICPSAPAMRGAWLGFSWGHTQAHFLRALLESIAFEYAYYLRILFDQLPDLEFLETRGVGGGARSNVWNQIKADAMGVPYQRMNGSEFGTWGCAMIAGYAIGLFSDLASTAIQRAIPEGAPAMPDPSKRAIYDRLIEKYIKLETQLDHYFEKSNNIERAGKK